MKVNITCIPFFVNDMKRKRLVTILGLMILNGCSSSKNILDKSTSEELAYDYLFKLPGGIYYEIKDAVVVAIIALALVRIGYRLLFPEASMGNDRGISMQTIMLDIGKILIATTIWYSLPRIFKILMRVY